MTVQELKLKIEQLSELKVKEISKQNYERAAQVRDEISKYTEQLKELMNQ